MANPVVTTSAKLQIPIQVIGSDLDGQQFVEGAHTLTLYCNGATILLANKLAPDSEVIVRNPETNEEALASVVGQIRKEDNGYVYGLAFLDLAVDFWHIQFLPAGPGGRVTLECSRCHSAFGSLLSDIEIEVFAARQELTRACAICKTSTIWKECAREVTQKPLNPPPNPDSSTQSSRSGPQERRKSRRTAMKAAACIRSSAQEEIASCEDISRGGFRFTSRKQYPEGTRIEAAVPYMKSSTNIFSPACVVFCLRMADGRYRHGVTYLKAIGSTVRES